MLVIIMCGCIGENSSKLLTSYSKANAKDIGERFIAKSEAYGFNGKTASCAEARQLDCDGCWQFKCTFRESDGSLFGGVIHTVDMSVKAGKVVNAVIDGNKSML